MSNLQVKTRQELGFVYPQGYVFLINNIPTMQLHFYPDYYTIFWPGNVVLQQLTDYLKETVEELSELFNVPRENFGSITAQYGRNRGPVTLSFSLYSIPYKLRDTLHHQNFIRSNYPIITFARFDVNSKIPIILWGDLTNSAQSELGFSSIKFLPSSILKLFKQTCSTNIGDDDFAEIKPKLKSLGIPQI